MAILELLEANAIPQSPVSSNWDAETYGGTKQANFLQKLYNFLALDPHPCPEVIYWASDSRQLVIAQPDRLVREVLPKLFKHDKLASFGRQLNIYGFSRLFPGRQFKDADGNVSDASVWAHPTLHRCSTSSEIGDVKRRAAPKLFRTRRLANGQVIRTKAGPAVEAKAREVRESIAESRRNRGSISYSESGITSSPSPSTQTRLPALQHAPSDLGVTSIRTPLRNSLTFADSASRLPDIAEGVVASHPPTPLFNGTYESFSSRRDSAMSIDQSPTQQSLGVRNDDAAVVAQQSARHLMFHQAALLHNDFIGKTEVAVIHAPPQAPPPTRPFQSCPASIHTSPVQAHMMLNSLTSDYHLPTYYPGVGQLGNGHGQPKIAIPAAPYPFMVHDQASHHGNTPLTVSTTNHAPITMYPLSPSSGEPSNVQSFANTPVQMQPGQILPNSVESTFHQIQPSWNSTGDSDSMPVDMTPTHRMSWEAKMPLSPGTGTIDPRWVSPMSSAWNSLAPTRVNTPLVDIQSAQSFTRGSVDVNQKGQLAQSSVQPWAASSFQDERGDLHPSQVTQPQVEHTHNPYLVHHDTQNQVDAPNPPQIPFLGTQSYPPRQVERRQMDISPPLPLLPTSGSSAHKEKEGYFGSLPYSSTDPQMTPKQLPLSTPAGADANPTGSNSLPGQLSGIGGGKWYL